MKKYLVILALSFACAIMVMSNEATTALDLLQSCTVSVDERV